MSERLTTDQPIQREEVLTKAFREDDYKTGKRLSLMYSTTSSRLTVDHNRESFDPPLKVEWSPMNKDDGGDDDLSAFLMTVSMPRILRIKLYKEETNNKRYLSDGLASAIVLAFNDYAPSDYVPTATNLKHRIFFAMQRLEADTGFEPRKVREFVEGKGGSKFDTNGSWSIKVGPSSEGSISQTIRFQLEKPLGWRPAIDATLLPGLTSVGSRSPLDEPGIWTIDALATNSRDASLDPSENPST